MTRRALSPSLVVAAVLADAQGEHRLAFYARHAPDPHLAVPAIPARRSSVHASGPALAWTSGLALALVVLAASLRAPTLAAGTVPPVALSAVVLALTLLAAQGVLELARGRLERQRPRRVAGQVD
jgi:hypothetical protein